jgi:DNA-binding NarL/FixJ family response regulator
MVRAQAAQDMDASEPVAIVVVEDHAAVRLGVEAILQRAGHTIAGGTEDVAAAYELIIGAYPDVALVDVSLQGGDGIEIARAVLGARPEQKVLLYTAFAEDRRLGEALAFGVRGVALKAGTPAELVEAVETVAADGVYLDLRLREVLGSTVGERPRAALSKREAETFALLAEGLTGEKIAHRLVLSSVTVRTHVRNGMRRLGARTRAHAAALALSSGEIAA